jgi:ubiquinone biosynthesis accessory factor UbiJ
MLALTAELVCSALERLIAKALALNINDTPVLTALEGKRLGIQLTELAHPMCLVVSEQAIFVLTDISAADCVLSSSIKTLYQLKQQGSLTELIRQGQLDLTGDIKVAQAFVQLAESLRIDWQTELADYIGDIATHKLVQCGNSLRNKSNFFAQQVSADSSEWLVHEQKLVVTKVELTQLYQNITNTERESAILAQRIERLLTIHQQQLK